MGTLVSVLVVEAAAMAFHFGFVLGVLRMRYRILILKCQGRRIFGRFSVKPLVAFENMRFASAKAH